MELGHTKIKQEKLIVSLVNKKLSCEKQVDKLAICAMSVRPAKLSGLVDVEENYNRMLLLLQHLHDDLDDDLILLFFIYICILKVIVKMTLLQYHQSQAYSSSMGPTSNRICNPC